jgi:hypothetical protein
MWFRNHCDKKKCNGPQFTKKVQPKNYKLQKSVKKMPKGKVLAKKNPK